MANQNLQVKEFCNRPYNLCCMVLGVLLILNSLICAIMYQHIQLFVHDLKNKELVISQNTLFMKRWKTPPMTPKLEVYIFNFTNAYEYLAGNDSKPNFQEIGPYIYESTHEKRVHEWQKGTKENEEMYKDNVIKFQHRTVYRKLPQENSVGNDDSDILLVPNLVLMSGMLRSDVQGLLAFLKQSVVWDMLQSSGKNSPILRLTVNEFLWGYEDELACIADETTTSEDPFAAEEDYDPFDDDYSSGQTHSSKTYADHKVTYRSPIDGRCMFGALRDKNATWERPTLMYTGKDDLARKGYILEVDGTKTFGAWKENSKCDSLVGLQQPSAFPPIPLTSLLDERPTYNEIEENTESDIDLFVGIMCRSIPLKRVASNNTSSSQFTKYIQPLRYEPAEYVFNPTSDKESCYYNEIDNQHLPRGVLGIQKCKFGTPFAVSFPHFLHADKWYLDQITGIAPAKKHDHELYIEIEPNLGVPVNMQIRFQVNLLLRRDSAFPPLANLQQDLTVIPIFWAQEGYDTVPDSTLTLMDIAILSPQIATGGLILFLLLLGGAITSTTVIKHYKRRRSLLSIELLYGGKMASDTETCKTTVKQQYSNRDVYSEGRRKSSSDNTATTASLLNESENSSKIRTSSSNSSSSLSYTKMDPMSDSLISPILNVPP